MIARLALLFTTVTLLELSILIPLGQAIGLFPTVAIVMGTAVLGASLAKRQGITIWRRIQQELSSGQLPKDSLLDGLAVLIAGAFLLTPGVLTDVAGILLLLPPTRAPLKALAKKYGKNLLDSPEDFIQQGNNGNNVHVYQNTVDVQPGPRSASEFGQQQHNSGAESAGDDVIDVEPIESDDSSSDPDPEPSSSTSDRSSSTSKRSSSTPDTSDNHVDPIGELSTSSD